MRLPIVRVGGKGRQGKIDVEAVIGLPEALSALEFHDSHFIAAEGQAVFATAHNGQPMVYVNGVLIGRTQFNATDLTKVTLAQACSAGDIVRIITMAGSLTASEGGEYLAGTGLDLIGSTFSVKYGTAAGTAAQGNDSRIEKGVTAHDWGDHADAGYLKAVDAPATPVITVSSSPPSGGNNGDVWFKV